MDRINWVTREAFNALAQLSRLQGAEQVRQARLDALGDLVADHLDTDAVLTLLEGGAPAGLPFVPPGAP